MAKQWIRLFWRNSFGIKFWDFRLGKRLIEEKTIPLREIYENLRWSLRMVLEQRNFNWKSWRHYHQTYQKAEIADLP